MSAKVKVYFCGWVDALLYVCQALDWLILVACGVVFRNISAKLVWKHSLCKHRCTQLFIVHKGTAAEVYLALAISS